MRDLTIHRVHGVGRQRTYNDDTPFNAQAFEQAIHGLQEIILKVVRSTGNNDTEPDSSQYEHDTENGTPIIRIPHETFLYNVCNKIIPSKWDMTVLIDDSMDNSYAVRASVDCGGGVLVYATLYLQDTIIQRLDIAHTSIADRSETKSRENLTIHSSSRDIAYVNRWLEQSVTAAYANTISSAARAFDFIATKEDIPAIGPRTPPVRNRRESLAQTEWADIRGKSKQTVSNNVRAAREQLKNRPDVSAFKNRRPALIELAEDNEYQEGDIRLV